MAVTFPSQGMIVDYTRPAPYSDPGAEYARATAALPSSRQVVQLNGTTPALVVAENSDDTGANFGLVEFQLNGTEVAVMGHTDAATLEAIAQSILAHWPSASS
jgi:hypothetical protein